MKNILVLTDFSEAADNAAEYAVKLAVELKANVILFHAVVSQEKVLVFPEPTEEMDDNHEAAVRACLLKLDVLYKKLQIILKEETAYKPNLSCLTGAANVNDCIQKVVTDHQIDLIVMGARLYSEHPGFLFGTNIRAVVETMPCPILLVHKHAVYRPLKNVFYVTDLRYSDLKTTALLINFAGPLNADVCLLHVCTDGLPALLNEDASAIFRDTIASHFNYKHLKYYNISDKDTQSVINRIIETHDMDILAIANKKYHFLNHLFRKNAEIITDVYTHIPILIIPDK